MLRVGVKLPEYVNSQTRIINFSRRQYSQLASKTVCEPVKPPQPLPCPPKKKSRFRRILGAMLIGGLGTVIYAKYDDKFRKTLYCYAPWTDGVIKFIFQEEKSYQDSISSWFGLHTESLPDDAGGKGGENVKEEPIVPVKKERERCEPGADESDDSDYDDRPKPVAQGALRKVSSAEDLIAFRQLVELETESIVRTYAAIKDHLQRHIKGVEKFVEGTSDILEADLRPVYKERLGLMIDKYTQLEQEIRDSRAKINDIRMKIRESKFEGARDIVESNKRKIDDCVKVASDASRANYEERLIKDACDQAFDKLNVNRVTLKEEVNALFPNLNIAEKITVLEEQEVDLFLVYTAIQIDHYRDAIKSLESSRDSRITRTLCQVAPDEVDGKQITNLVADGVAQRKKEAALQSKKKIAELKSECEREVAKQLARQTEVHLASLQEIKSQRANQLRAQYADEMERTVRGVREKNAASLKEMHQEVKELDELFRARTDRDFSAHRSQGLWAAGWAIARAINQFMPAAAPKEKLVKLGQEIDDVVKASVEGDELITSVVRSFPQEAKSRGVFTQEALLERFDKVAKVALMTSIVPEEGGPLPLYFLSWLQSWFLSTGSDMVPSSLKQQVPHSLAHVENHTIIKEARYWLERGDLVQALKYMNSLKGYSRKVASTWICEVQRHLETQQAADIIMAHAVAKGML